MRNSTNSSPILQKNDKMFGGCWRVKKAYILRIRVRIVYNKRHIWRKSSQPQYLAQFGAKKRIESHGCFFSIHIEYIDNPFHSSHILLEKMSEKPQSTTPTVDQDVSKLYQTFDILTDVSKVSRHYLVTNSSAWVVIVLNFLVFTDLPLSRSSNWCALGTENQNFKILPMRS